MPLHQVLGGFLYVSTDCPHMAVDMERVMSRHCHSLAENAVVSADIVDAAVDAGADDYVSPLGDNLEAVHVESDSDDDADAGTGAPRALHEQTVLPCMVRIVEAK